MPASVASTFVSSKSALCRVSRARSASLASIEIQWSFIRTDCRLSNPNRRRTTNLELGGLRRAAINLAKSAKTS